MTAETIDERITALRKEQAILSQRHDQLLAQVNQHQTRFQQLKGGIAELEWMKTKLNGATPT